MSRRIAVYVCHCGSNIAGKVDVRSVSEMAKSLPDVVLAKEYQFMCSEPGQELIRNDIRECGLDGVVVAACSPLMHEGTFRAACSSVGLNHYLMQMANIREQCSWVTEDPDAATEKAKSIVAGAVGKLRSLKPLAEREVPVVQSVLVVGGGIAGIQAAIQCAEAGYKVYLVERKQSIGGHMAMLDKTFPTLDCSACILTPKMVKVGQHPNIRLLAYSEVEAVGGYAGNMKVRIRRRAAYVDHERCNGCGLCQERCPGKVSNEFEQGKGERRAIYTLFPQAVPSKPVIDREACIYFQKGKCRACEKLCRQGAVDFEQKDLIEEIQVGAIILATGHSTFDARKMPQYGYGKYADVYTALEVERMVNSGGFSEGHIRLSDGSTPKAVAIVHCVGSRDQRHHPYCSEICCMYSLKLAHLIKEHTDATVYNLYIDMRCVGKGYEEFFDRLMAEGVHFVRGKVASVASNGANGSERGKLLVRAEDTLAEVIREIPVDMVVLATALEPTQGTEEVGKLFGVARNQAGFFIEQHPKLNPFGTSNVCTFIAGTCAGPKDIPYTVSQASAAASGAITLLRQGKVLVESIAARNREEHCASCLTCVSVCPYGAITHEKENDRVSVDETLCQGCGTCVAACPAGAMEADNYTDEQILEEIEAVLSWKKSIKTKTHDVLKEAIVETQSAGAYAEKHQLEDRDSIAT
ncbi:MAG: CoB--CoM heterodisulfide reductase iron-sulfur subunit A family protein [Candidatus Eiseniibacteriota bacterium]|nr:MAG: CoB--CoM heterodisulfide reductase iron-sulfur subunit A family protein [Candidatus Eisenbacteria bacterium]